MKKQHFATFRTAYDVWYLVNQQLPNPDPVLKKKAGGIGIYKELLGDSEVRSCLRSLKAPVLSSEWQLERRGGPVKFNKAMEDWFEGLDHTEFLETFLNIDFWGYYPVEILWEYRNGYFLPSELSPKPPEWFFYFIPESGVPELRYLSKKDMINGEPIPNRYSMICPRISPSFANPYGEGVAGLCFWPVAFKKAGLEFWLNMLERFAMPWIKGNAGQGATDADMDEFQNRLEAMVQDAIVVLSGEQDVSLIADTGRTTAAGDMFERMCDWQNRQIQKAILSQTLTSEVGDKGALSTAKVHGGVRDDIVDALYKLTARCYQTIIGMIANRNGFPASISPRVKAFEEEDIRKDLAERDDKLSKSLGASKLMFSKEYFMRSYALGEKDFADTDDGIPPETNQDRQGELVQKAEFSESRNFRPGFHAVDAVASDAALRTVPAVDRLLAPLMRRIKKAKSAEEVYELLYAWYPESDITQFQEIVSRALTFAGMTGAGAVMEDDTE